MKSKLKDKKSVNKLGISKKGKVSKIHSMSGCTKGNSSQCSASGQKYG